MHPLTVYEGARDLVSFFRKQKGVKVVLLGAKSEGLLKREVEQAGFDGLFDAVLGNTGNPITDKPNKGAFDRATQGIDIIDKKKDVLYIGDNAINDTKFADSWGADSCIVQPKKSKTALRALLASFEQTHAVFRCIQPTYPNENQNLHT